jgi:DNA-binding transcriptional LysR family regulator
MLDVRRLRVLKEVADQGSFSAAADALSYTQSAVSQQIAALEREAGTQLVQRGARGVRLTEAGESLVAHSEAIICRLAAAEADLEAIAGLRGGRLRLASFPTAGATLVPLAIAEFSRLHPAVELSLIEAEPEDALPRLKAGELDIALAFKYHTLPRSAYATLMEGVETVHLLDDRMSVALPSGHRLAHKTRLTLAELSGERWIQGDPQGLCGAMHVAACELAGFEPHVAFQSDDYNVVQGLVAAGVAISLIPELALTNLREDIVIRPLPKRETPVRGVVAATLASGSRSPATAAMLETLERAAKAYLAAASPFEAAQQDRQPSAAARAPAVRGGLSRQQSAAG